MIIFTRMPCPVRAVKIYIKRTKSVRNNWKRLFIPVCGQSDLNKSSISRWVKFAIRVACLGISKSPSKLFNPRAHEFKALSASWAYLNNTPLEEVLSSAVWSSSSIFAQHYLRDFSAQMNNLRALGPIVAAQTVMGGTASLLLDTTESKIHLYSRRQSV